MERDFRIASKGWGAAQSCSPCGIEAKGLCANLRVLWRSEELAETGAAGSGVYVAHMEPPEGGRRLSHRTRATQSAPGSGQARHTHI